MASYGGSDPRDQISIPAIGLIVTGVVDIFMYVLYGGLQMYNISRVVGGGLPIGVDSANTNQPGFKEGVYFGIGGACCTSVLLVIVAVLVILGANKMRNLQSYGWAMTSAILGTIPCISCCFPLGMAFGIWAIVLLIKPEVKAAFR